MNKELIIKLIERARSFSENAYCPYTNSAIGCSLLVDDNIIFGGCNIENGVLSSSAEAGAVAILKAVSEGHTRFYAICLWSENKLPYPSGHTRQLLSEFNQDTNIIVATEATYSVLKLADLYPFPPEAAVE